MTKEEKQKAIDALKISTPVMGVTQEEFKDYYQTLNKIKDWLEQEPSDDAISRQWLMKCVNEGWIKFDTEKDNNRFIHLIRDIAPSVTPVNHQETVTEFTDRCCECGAEYGKLLKQKQNGDFTVLEDIKAEIKQWYWQADKQALTKDPCVVDSMINLFIRTIEKKESEEV